MMISGAETLYSYFLKIMHESVKSKKSNFGYKFPATKDRIEIFGNFKQQTMHHKGSATGWYLRSDCHIFCKCTKYPRR
ncbi:hypothetical protein WA026_011389 [Henosepilachna vigintioctopunctata]|uniref:Uncharacterized protein n=1 Tax=Henosepilachna vigintioctopunctata TaxID=420089 RepID=A0AAW1TLI0_9CUCU